MNTSGFSNKVVDNFTESKERRLDFTYKTS